MPSKKEPKVTIVTVVFNGGDRLEKTIESIVRQTYANKEYIIVDGGSTDGTLDVIKKYDDDIDKWISEKDAGLYDAMNKGIDLATGDWVIFMNCDDWFCNDTVIEKVFASVEEGADFICGDVIYRMEDGHEFYDKCRPLDEMWKRISFSHQSLFTKTSIARKKKFDLRYDIVADYNFYYGAYKDGCRFQYYPGPVGVVAAGGVSDRSLLGRTLQRWEVVRRHEQDVEKDKYYVKLLTDFVFAETGQTWKSVAPRTPAIRAGPGQRGDSRKTVFTVVTPTYNCAATIDQTIQSVVTQIGRFSIQYVIVDGLSNDSTVDRIKHWQASLSEGKVKVECDEICLKYICEKDEGIYDAIEKGFRNCDYQVDALNVMTWINGDDFLTQGALATVCQVYSENDSVQWVTGIRQIFDNVKGMITPTAPLVYPKYFLANGLCDGTHFPFVQQEGTFWKNELYKKVGGLDSKLKYVGDYDLWRRFGQEEHLLVIDNVLGVFRKRPGQKSENIEEYKKEIDACTDFDDRASKFYEILYKSEKKIEEGLIGKKARFSFGQGRWLFHDVLRPIESLPPHVQERYWKYRIARRSSEEKSTPAASSPDTSHRVEAKPNSARPLGARVEGLARKLARFTLSPAARNRIKRWIRVRAIRRSGLFFSEFYREQIEKTTARVPESDYIKHYIETGAATGYDPNPLFSSKYYLNTYKGMSASDENPLYHYIKIGHQLAMNPGPDFDTKFYRSHMRLAKNENPLVHYFKTGIIQDAPRKA